MASPTIQQNYQVQSTSPNGFTVLLGTVSLQAIAANLNRRGIMFLNPSAVTIYVCPGNQAAVIGQGIPILPGGGPVSFIGDGVNVFFNCAWNAISASGSGNPLTILEIV
jgi:hypothetical protein